MSRPEISVIVPVYNVEPYLPLCVDSILSQSFGNFEIILVDDGSTDSSGKLCEQYAEKDPRIRVFHQKNQGLSGARNAGTALVQGRYFTYIDSDDFVSSYYLEEMYQQAENTGAEVVICQSLSFQDGDPSLEEKIQKNEETFLAIFDVMTGKTACKHHYIRDIDVPISAWGKLYHESLRDIVSFPIGRLHEDQFIIPIVLYLSKKIALTHDRMYYYRIRKGSITSSFNAKRFDNIIGMNHVIEYFKRNKENALVSLAKEYRNNTLAIYTILAKKEGIRNPDACKMSDLRAFSILRKQFTHDQYSYFLSFNYPSWIYIDDCIRKIERSLHELLGTAETKTIQKREQ